jgi:hypothetical protein
MPPHGKLGLSMAGAPTRMATTGIYSLRGVPRDLHRACVTAPWTRRPRYTGSPCKACASMWRAGHPNPKLLESARESGG